MRRVYGRVRHYITNGISCHGLNVVHSQQTENPPGSHGMHLNFASNTILTVFDDRSFSSWQHGVSGTSPCPLVVEAQR